MPLLEWLRKPESLGRHGLNVGLRCAVPSGQEFNEIDIRWIDHLAIMS